MKVIEKERITQRYPSEVVEPTEVQNPPSTKNTYQKKKGIFRADQIIWYILAIIEIIIGFRFILKILGANPLNGFTSFIYMISEPLIYPFRTIFSASVFGNSVFEWSILVAAIVYLVVAYILSYLLTILYPVTPRDLDTSVTP